MNKIPTHFIVYKTVDQKIAVDVRLENGSIWFSIVQMAKIFESNCNTIEAHIAIIYAEQEVQATCRKPPKIQPEGKVINEWETHLYNLDVIISLSFKVKSIRGLQLRQWATKLLSEYIRKGFLIDDERLKDPYYHQKESCLVRW